jgi:hypothetical protein
MKKKGTIQWLVADAGWTLQQKGYIQDAASAAGLSKPIKWLTSKDAIHSSIEYCNQSTANRRKDRITEFYVFSHGFSGSGGSIELGSPHSNYSRFSWKKDHIKDLDKRSFKKTKTQFYSCNTATALKKSFAYSWAKKTKGKTKAAIGKTDYSHINSFEFSESYRKWKKSAEVTKNQKHHIDFQN